MARKIAGLLALTAFLLAAASPALAERRWFMSGTLDDYDSAATTIEVSERTIQLTTQTLIKNEDGSLGNWSDVEARDGEYVEILVSAGHPHPVARTIRLVDEVEDE